MSTLLSVSRRRRLASCVMAMFALASGPAGATVLVTNCFDHGAGSLRDAVAAAAPGESVDASGLTKASPGCTDSTITLTTGEIVANGSLALGGPGKDQLTITAFNAAAAHQYQNRIFNIKGTGASYIGGLTVSHGVFAQPVALPAKGGCIYSAGPLNLNDVGVSDCVARADSDGNALGGGVYAQGQIHLTNSTVSGNMADAGASGGAAFGGGLYATDQIVIKRSSILDNYAGHPGRATGVGGGFLFHSNYGIDMEYSTIAHNKAGFRCGGGEALGGQLPANVLNNTIAYNSSVYGRCGGLHVVSPQQLIVHNTIAFNSAEQSDTTYGPGLTVSSSFPYSYTHLVFNIVIYNANAAGVRADLTVGANQYVYNEVNIGSSKIVGRSSHLFLEKTCPRLRPLRDNGGPTLTMALSRSGSAIDRAENVPSNLDYDQRGAPYARISGAQADIGAYEYQQDDMIFGTGFDEGMSCG